MKDMIRKSQLIHSTLQHKFVINKNVTFEENQIADTFNNFFINIGPKLADDIPTSQDLSKAKSKTLMKQ